MNVRMVNSALSLQVLPLVVLLGTTRLCVSMFYVLSLAMCQLHSLLSLEHLADVLHFRTPGWPSKRCLRGKPRGFFSADIYNDKEWPIWVHSETTLVPGVCSWECSHCLRPGHWEMLQTTGLQHGLLNFMLKGLDTRLNRSGVWAGSAVLQALSSEGKSIPAICFGCLHYHCC